MKFISNYSVGFAVLLSSAQIQLGQPVVGQSPGPTIVERGPHHRIWERTVLETNVWGQVTTNTSSYTELETGMHYQRDGQWVESEAKIELLGDGAVATKTPHKVSFAANLNTVGAIDLTTPDGKRLRSRILGLSYFDEVSGKAVLIAQLKDSIGLLVGDEQVVYTNAFDDVEADVQYLYSKAGLEQNVVVRAAPPSPTEFGLDPATTRLQVLTEFYDAPVPTKSVEVKGTLVDETLDFGNMMIGRGKAFPVGEAGGMESATPVAKQWTDIAGRTFLVEEVPYKAVTQQIEALARKRQGASLNLKRQGQGVGVIAALQQVLPKGKAGRGAGKMLLAQLAPNGQRGFVMDYTLLTSQTNFTFAGNTNYYVAGLVSLSAAGAGAATTIEGGTTIKFTNHPSAKLAISGNLVCQTDPYRSAILTSKDDNTVGEVINGSTGNPTNYNGGTYLSVSGSSPTFKYLRISYAGTGLFGAPDAGGVWHCQFVRCGTAIQANDTDVALRNVLFTQCGTAVGISYSGDVLRGEHVTADQLTKFFDASGCTGYLTNSILSAVTNLGAGMNLYSCVTNASGAGIYQQVGAGGYYLADNSQYRDNGTTNVNVDLLATLRKKATYPPIVLSNIFVVANTVLPLQAQRDTDLPDLGYHYDPLDYLVHYCMVTNATLTIPSGVAIACYNSSAGIWLQDGSSIVSTGTPLVPNRFVHYALVQEQPVYLGDVDPITYLVVNPYHYGSTGPSGDFRFSRFISPAGAYGLYHGSDNSFSSLSVQDCEVWNGKNYFNGASGTVAKLNNNLFRRASIAASATPSTTLTLSNNLVSGTSATFLNFDSANLWRFHDNSFDNSTVSSSFKPLTNSHNAYINCSGRLNPTNANDVVLANFTYASGPLGDYYQTSTNLFNAGSVNDASLVGLYHYTTTTNLVSGLQSKETNSVLDIGLHYIAVNSSGQPINTDGDDVADYFEDTNGNGNGGDDATSWQTHNSPNGMSSGSGLQVFTPLK